MQPPDQASWIRRHERLLLLLLLVGVILPRATFLFRQDEGVVAIPVLDDGFYNLTIARNIATGKGFTFDGTGVTTGFHPLVVLVAVPVFALCGGGTLMPLRIILTFYVLLGILLAWMIYRLVRHLAGPGPGLAALLMYATASGTGVLLNTLNGCDSVIGGVLLITTVWYYLTRVRCEADPPVRRYLVVGFLGGSLGLARLDLGIFAAFLGLDLFLVRMRCRPLRIGRLAGFGLTGLATVIPWVVFNLAMTGRPLPDNGRAVTMISRATAPYEVRLGEGGLLRTIGGNLTPSLAGAEPYDDDRPPASFYRTMVAHAVLAYLHDTPHTGIASTLGTLLERGLDIAGLKAWSTSLRRTGFHLILNLCLAGLLLILLLLRHRRLADLPALRQVWFLLPAGIILFLAYPLVVFGAWFLGRYYFPLALITLIYTPVFATLLWRSWTPGRVALFSGVFIGAFLLDTAPGLLNPVPRNFYNQARRIATHLPENAVIGAVQAGHLGFFCPQRVINLDGKVSTAAYRALAERRVLEYARSRGVRYITDWPMLVELLILLRSDPADRARMVRLEPPPASPESCSPLGWVTYSLATR